MARLIDAVTAASAVSEKHGIPLADLVDTFADIPTVDAVPVVRCRDCKYRSEWKTSNYGYQWCGTSGVQVVDDMSFCSYGARRDKE